jgi:hypothetical protein
MGDHRVTPADPRLDPDITVWASTDAGFGARFVGALEHQSRSMAIAGHGRRARSA